MVAGRTEKNNLFFQNLYIHAYRRLSQQNYNRLNKAKYLLSVVLKIPLETTSRNPLLCSKGARYASFYPFSHPLESQALHLRLIHIEIQFFLNKGAVAIYQSEQ